MEYYLENEVVRIKAVSFGGELKSMVDKETGKEYLWQGNPEFWRETAPNLFPYIARLTEGKCTFEGKEYEMKNHGLAKYRELEAKAGEKELIFALESDEDTLAHYPFRFRYEVQYRLDGKKLLLTYHVENKDDKTMYFAVGGHPGFNIPFVEGTEFEDYILRFPEAKEPKQIKFSEDCFVEGEFPFEDMENGFSHLKHEWFALDAVVLHGAGSSVTIELDENSKKETVAELAKTSPKVCVRFPQMEYIGFWHRPKTEAPYMCVEPWSSLPSRKGIVEDLAKQENLISLAAGETYENHWEIEII